ncbi:MAG TPA: EAL domain-containing protein [Ilumatobacteraceae bacterium]|nr:EAL domain-containing protein [Ilumatobacteraceae bacterium]
MSSNPYDHRLVSAHRDILLGGGLIGAFAVVVACTVWPVGQHGLSSRAIDVAVLTSVTGIALMKVLWRSTSEHLLLLFPTTLLVAQVWIAVSTDGIAANYSGFFALAIIYVGLTQRRVVVAMAVAIVAPCWLICQELTTVTVTTVARLATAITFWLVAGLALASRAELDKAHTNELLDRANTDPLTGLASRLFLSDQIEREIGRRSGQESTVMVIDLDGFKGVNDMFGHAAGDELLTTIAGWIRASFRPADVCARLGGDEFAVLLRNTDASQATEAAARLLEELARPIVLPRGRMAITASIGIASLTAASDALQVLRDADLAMYDAKLGGRNRASVFEQEMSDRRSARLQLESELLDGMGRDEFELFYQPVVHVQTGAIIGTEALLRWNHPQRGLLGPDQFLDTSEEIGVIVALGDWILREACQQAVRWQPADPGKAISMAVNVSAPEMLAPDFVSRVRKVLATTGLPGRLLILEITEGLVINEASIARERIDELGKLGIRIAIDDFGTGYSSLACLRDLPVDILKIDQSFVKPLGVDAQAAALLKSIIAIADALRLAIIVEGVETSTHVDIVKELGCEVAQGYHFARPGTASSITDLFSLELTTPHQQVEHQHR